MGLASTNLTMRDLESNKLSPERGAAYYHLKVTDFEVGEWEDGRKRLDIDTEVVCGEQMGRKAPRITLTVGESTFEARGKEIHVTDEESHKSFIRYATRIYGGDVPIDKMVWDDTGLTKVGKLLLDRTFHARVQRDKNDYDRIAAIYPTEKITLALPDGEVVLKPLSSKSFQDDCQMTLFKA